MALTKADLTKSLLDLNLNNLSKNDSLQLVEDFFEIIRNKLEAGTEVKLSGFGNFRTRDKRQRPGRNPKTGAEIPVAARRVVTFHAGQKLKARVAKLAEKASEQQSPGSWAGE